jgi:hypothetical protein
MLANFYEKNMKVFCGILTKALLMGRISRFVLIADLVRLRKRRRAKLLKGSE